MIDLKYRARLSTSIDIGIYKAFYNYSAQSLVPMSRMLDEAIGDFLKKRGVTFYHRSTL